MPTVYDLVVRTHVSVLRPTRPLAEDEVRLYVRDALACVGQPLPESLTDPEFAERLAETGLYDEAIGDVKITVRRSK